MNKLIVRPGFFNEAFYPLHDDRTELQIIYGGAGSGKSVFTAAKHVLNVAAHDRNVLVVRNTANTLKKSVWNEIESAISDLHLTPFFKFNRTEMTITCKYNKRQIVFVGCNDTERLKSIRPVKGIFEDIWVEEATEVSERAFNQLQMRQRGRTPHKKCITLTFNPIYKGHWIEKRFFPAHNLRRGIFRDPNRDLLIHKSTYLDNAFLTPQDRAKYESYAYIDGYYYNVYVLGNWGVLGNVIFTNWEVADLSEYRFSNFRNGLDFGFSNDPTALSRTVKRGNVLYVPPVPGGELYATGLLTDAIYEEVYKRVGTALVVCDSAEPRTVAELREKGLYAEKAIKGPDSVRHGIQWLKQLKIIVDETNQKAINELSTYRWREDRDGNPINEPEDANNHWIDATRYANEFDMLRWSGEAA